MHVVMAPADYAYACAAPTLPGPIRTPSIAYPTSFRAPRSGLVQWVLLGTPYALLCRRRLPPLNYYDKWSRVQNSMTMPEPNELGQKCRDSRLVGEAPPASAWKFE